MRTDNPYITANNLFKEDQFINATQDKLPSRANEAFKPNGITDNRMEWLFGGNNLLSVKELFINFEHIQGNRISESHNK